jgi:hypothetical protein
LVLKGALMLHVWDAPLARATKDLDFLGRLDNSLENLDRVVREVCAVDVEPDGVVFDPSTVKAERIKEDAEYEGVRVRFVGLLGKARVAMQIDVGFGDVVTPAAESITYPALLDFPAPELSGYPRETVVAEKFQAMVYLRTINSRMKDFYDTPPQREAIAKTSAHFQAQPNVRALLLGGSLVHTGNAVAKMAEVGVFMGVCFPPGGSPPPRPAVLGLPGVP